VFLHDLPINPAGFTGRQIMQGTNPLRDLSVLTHMSSEPELNLLGWWKHAAKCGTKPQ